MRGGQHLSAQKRKLIAHRGAAQDLEFQSVRARLAGVTLELADQFGAVTVADADVSGLYIFDICAHQVLHSTPYRRRPIRKRELRQRTPLAANVAEVGATRLLPDQPTLNQCDRAAALAQKERTRRAHDAATHDQYIG